MHISEKKKDLGACGQPLLRNWLSRAVLTTLAVASLLFASASAQAACDGFTGMGLRGGLQLPMLGQAENDVASSSGTSGASIVGLWHVVYTAGGKLFNESFDQWHSDGTEFENAFLAPAQGNICFGVWKTISAHSVRLHHIGWTFTPGTNGTATGMFTVDETNTVSHSGNSYTGSFHFKAYNLNGTKEADVTGTILATRITVE